MVEEQLNADALPLGVLVPTFNSMPWLERHVKALRPWLHRVQEVVTVDSQSSDGTSEYLLENLNGTNVRHLSHPPGLYESWNFGLRQIRAPWTYIATVGDTMPEKSIEALLAVGQQNNSDLVISPPRMMSMSGETLDKRWPIHRYIEWKGENRSGLIDGLEVFLWNVLSVPGSLLGSSASNIYRTGYLHDHPFPLGYSHACDTAWAVINSFQARWAIATGVYSEFLVHPASQHGSDEPLRHLTRERLHQLGREVFDALPDESFPEKQSYAGLLNEYWDVSLQSMKARHKFRAMRKQAIPWLLRPAGWRERNRRHRYIVNVERCRESIFQLLSDSGGASVGN
jgi:glycosyltransferase involved in cell wall biosynthesis